MPESNASENAQQAPPTEAVWHDKIIGDAVAYTKGLVSILDSLTEGFRRRGRELEEVRHRLTILQNERRTSLEGRGGIEAQLGALTAEREELRSRLETQKKELDQLRVALAQSQAVPETRPRETQEPQVVAREATRQAEELREIVRSLERDRLRAQQSAAQAQQEQVALRDSLARTEGLLEATRRDLTSSQEQSTRLQSLLKTQSDFPTADRKRLERTLEERTRALDQFRQDLSQSQVALEIRTREVQQFQAAGAEATRQAEELRERIRALERERDSDAQRHATCLAEMEGALQQVRESAAQAQQEHVALRDSLARTEGLLEATRRDLTSSQELSTSLRGALEEERAQTEYLRDRLRAQHGDFSSLSTTMEAARRVLGELAASVGGPLDVAADGGEADQEGTQWAKLVERVRLQTETSAQTQEELATLRQLAESVREVLGATDALPERLRKLVAERVLLTERVQQIATEWVRLREERTESDRREELLREENTRLAARAAMLTREMKTLRSDAERRRQPSAKERQARMAEAAAEQQGLDARKTEARTAPQPRQADVVRSMFGPTRPQEKQ